MVFQTNQLVNMIIWYLDPLFYMAQAAVCVASRFVQLRFLGWGFVSQLETNIESNWFLPHFEQDWLRITMMRPSMPWLFWHMASLHFPVSEDHMKAPDALNHHNFLPVFIQLIVLFLASKCSCVPWTVSSHKCCNSLIYSLCTLTNEAEAGERCE